jgi:hypothetical protein
VIICGVEDLMKVMREMYIFTPVASTSFMMDLIFKAKAMGSLSFILRLKRFINN